ncbi:ribosome biogenesis GTPase YlqF [Savagea faecisuis]|uniref:Ribosome biogenesis GTPase A n=1 Tax=Savagea faecisuis TaxID=1274803 RepID=A0ABW3GX81_9BACL
MTIQWFPGHMAKARREVSEQLKLVDIVFELVDARLPQSSRNPMIDEVLGEKPRIVLLNKRDLADPRWTERWIRHYEQQGVQAVAINSFQNEGLQDVLKASRFVLKEKFEKMQAKGIRPRAIRAMVVGIPNVGKSTLINRFARKNIAKTGNKPGVTKAQQWIKVGKELELLDTPGILWPKFEDKEAGYKLALTGAIKDQVLSLDDVAIYGLRYIAEHYPERLEARYGFATLHDEIVETFDEIGKLRGAYERGGDIDYSKVAEIIVQDVRQGELGKLTFDTFDEETE